MGITLESVDGHYVFHRTKNPPGIDRKRIHLTPLERSEFLKKCQWANIPASALGAYANNVGLAELSTDESYSDFSGLISDVLETLGANGISYKPKKRDKVVSRVHQEKQWDFVSSTKLEHNPHHYARAARSRRHMRVHFWKEDTKDKNWVRFTWEKDGVMPTRLIIPGYELHHYSHDNDEGFRRNGLLCNSVIAVYIPEDTKKVYAAAMNYRSKKNVQQDAQHDTKEQPNDNKGLILQQQLEKITKATLLQQRLGDSSPLLAQRLQHIGELQTNLQKRLNL
jgi:hypothetical protein